MRRSLHSTVFPAAASLHGAELEAAAGASSPPGTRCLPPPIPPVLDGLSLASRKLHRLRLASRKLPGSRLRHRDVFMLLPKDQQLPEVTRSPAACAPCVVQSQLQDDFMADDLSLASRKDPFTVLGEERIVFGSPGRPCVPPKKKKTKILRATEGEMLNSSKKVKQSPFNFSMKSSIIHFAAKSSEENSCQVRVPRSFRVPLNSVDWPQLFRLQNQDGFWQLTSELGMFLDLDVHHLINVSLAKTGIQSLGPKGKEKLLKLIATLLVLQAIYFKQLEGLIFKSLMKLKDSPPSWALNPVRKAIEWANRTNREFPGICQRLQLGKDWDDATKKLLGI